MADENIQSLERRLLQDDQLLGRFREAPHEVVAEHGIEVSDEQGEKLQNHVRGKSHEEVKAKLQTDGLRAMF